MVGCRHRYRERGAVTFAVSFPTRHTDTFAATGFVHAGVLLALKSAELAADSIAEGIAKYDLSAAQLGKWGPGFNEGMDRMRRLVCAYYDGFSFGAFVRRYPNYKGHLTDLLIGNLFNDQVGEVFGPMEEMWPEVTAAGA